MRDKKKDNGNNLPSADIILDLINDEEEIENKILDFYGSYICIAATIHMTSPIIGDLGYRFDEDLAQEIRKEIVGCLPALKKLIKKEIKSEQPILVIVSLQ